MYIQVVGSAYTARVSLMSEGFFATPNLDEISNDNPQGNPFYYFNYAAAVSEVEIDSLTGEFSIIRSDIVYDAGHSLNPAIDVGQVCTHHRTAFKAKLGQACLPTVHMQYGFKVPLT